jgi:hypothetical protein
VIEGPAAIGKTRLLRSAGEIAEGNGIHRETTGVSDRNPTEPGTSEPRIGESKESRYAMVS